MVQTITITVESDYSPESDAAFLREILAQHAPVFYARVTSVSGE
jgi:hypothetical protein